MFKILGSGAVFIYLILAGSIEVRPIALAILPHSFSSAKTAAELGIIWKIPNPAPHLEVKFEVLGDRTHANPAPGPALQSLREGIYLYGESPQPSMLQKEYFVFEVRQSKVVGAFYLPRSAFYCFYGNVELTQLNLTVVDSFDRTTSPYSVNLQHYYPISAVSDNDRRILDICKTAHQQQVWD
jgi:hypothetical protein